jgi:hypothetical protein
VYLVLLVQLVEGVVKVVEPGKRIAALGWVNWKKMELILKYKVGLKYLLKPTFITQIVHTILLQFVKMREQYKAEIN